MGNSGACAAVILAAGRSSRMGQHKLLLPLGGQPLITYAVTAACVSIADPVVVVLGYDAEAVKAALPPGRYRRVTNPEYAQGMATSLRAGLAAVGSSVAGALILLADQPLVTSAMINRLLAVAATFPDDIIAASYAAKRGNPVYFPRSLFAEVYAVTGDEGGRLVITRHPDRLHLVEMENPQAALDVDRLGDYERLIADWSRYAETAGR